MKEQETKQIVLSDEFLKLECTKHELESQLKDIREKLNILKNEQSTYRELWEDGVRVLSDVGNGHYKDEHTGKLVQFVKAESIQLSLFQ